MKENLYPPKDIWDYIRDFATIYVGANASPDFVRYTPEGKPRTKEEQINLVIMICLKGWELQIPLGQAVTGIHLENGKYEIYGDLLLALIYRDSPESVFEFDITTKGTKIKIIKHPGDKPQTVEFSSEDAAQAGLLNNPKKTPWLKYHIDMMFWRAVSRMSKRYFPEITKGMIMYEEAEDSSEKTAPKYVPMPLNPAPMPEISIQEEEFPTETIETKEASKIELASIPEKTELQKTESPAPAPTITMPSIPASNLTLDFDLDLSTLSENKTPSPIIENKEPEIKIPNTSIEASPSPENPPKPNKRKKTSKKTDKTESKPESKTEEDLLIASVESELDAMSLKRNKDGFDPDLSLLINPKMNRLKANDWFLGLLEKPDLPYRILLNQINKYEDFDRIYQSNIKPKEKSKPTNQPLVEFLYLQVKDSMKLPEIDGNPEIPSLENIIVAWFAQLEKSFDSFFLFLKNNQNVSLEEFKNNLILESGLSIDELIWIVNFMINRGYIEIENNLVKANNLQELGIV